MTILGRYAEIYKSNDYPRICDNIHCPCMHKEKILTYMKSCASSSTAPAILTDVLTGEKLNISLECKNDGVYCWRTDYIYYIEKYDLKIPDDFIRHVLNKTA